MLWTVLTVAILAADPAPAVAEDRCAAWALNGYRLGMSMDEAGAIRPLKKTMKAGWDVPQGWTLHFARTPDFLGYLAFDEHGRLGKYMTQPRKANPAEVRLALEQRMGDPGQMNEQAGVTTRGFSRGVRPIRETLWTSAECDALVSFAVMRIVGIEHVEVMLRRLGDVQGAGDKALQ